ncbi:MAG: succinylglutamate desuccinylase/aspartoacylase family protein [Flavobacteriales bacterium]|nr:succinylglutamate desuccinylase/aspartoacylase family protein [Flavobacteriales bacterium]
MKYKIYSKALDKTIEVGRVIAQFKGKEKGPTLLFFGGIHGNEPSGIFALYEVFQELDVSNDLIGNVYAISGNLKALKSGERFSSIDLNRVWTKEFIDKIESEQSLTDEPDLLEMQEIHFLIRKILKESNGPFYFFDLHTTSAETIPFITANDSMLIRKFAEQYPIPIIFGIEEYLTGPLLSYINEFGYISIGHEAGSHDQVSSIENHKSFIYLSLVFSGCIKKEKIHFMKYYNGLAKTSVDSRAFYEIFYRYKIHRGEKFKMNPGYYNFQKIKKGQILAFNNGKEIRATRSGRVFMPLYQAQGEDGFFGIHRVPPFKLKVSNLLRKAHFDRLLPLLPGVNWSDKNHKTLLVNRRIARLFAKQFFHLLGYRARRISKTHLIIENRESASRKADYKTENWY